MAFSLGVIILFIASCLFATALYQKADSFSSFPMAAQSVFSIGFGDSIRENMMNIREEPFVLVFNIVLVCLFYSSLSQVYIGIFIGLFQKKMEQTKKIKQDDAVVKKRIDQLDLKRHATQSQFLFDREEKALSKYTERHSKRDSALIKSNSNKDILSKPSFNQTSIADNNKYNFKLDLNRIDTIEKNKIVLPNSQNTTKFDKKQSTGEP